MIDIVIKDFPMCPSVNKCWMPIIGKVKYKNGRPYGAGRLVKTKDYTDFEARCVSWELRYKSGLQSLKNDIILRKQELAKQGKILALKLELFAIFPRDKIFTSSGKLEIIDADNRIKPAQDVLSKILCLDDKHIFKNEIEKVSGSSEYMVIKITEHIPHDETTIKMMLGIK